MFNQTLAINSIKIHGEDNGWGEDAQLIVACTFISKYNLDEKFEEHLKEEGEKEKK